ncbi:MAG: response regulator [Deltaproteobacteria bacterium]|nr:response regulator [Deltaproteobacteria bacterium]
MNLLIVEDNPSNQFLINMLMEYWGYNTDIASNGREAVELAKVNEGKYDLCLMDIDLPIMDGCEATRIIRNQLRYLPILAITADIVLQYKYMEIGMDDILEKPYDPDVLYGKICELTVKSEKIYFNDNNICIKKEMPMDAQHAQEIKKLKNQGLVKMRLDGPDEREIITHKNTPNKISHDFNIKKYLMTEFINRDPDQPTLCDLYRGSKNFILETFLDEEDYSLKTNAEDDEMAKYTMKVFKTEEE